MGSLTGADTLSVVALAQETMNTANREGQTSFGRATRWGKLDACATAANVRQETKNSREREREEDVRLGGLASRLSTRFAASHFFCVAVVKGRFEKK